MLSQERSYMQWKFIFTSAFLATNYGGEKEFSAATTIINFPRMVPPLLSLSPTLHYTNARRGAIPFSGFLSPTQPLKEAELKHMVDSCPRVFRTSQLLNFSNMQTSVEVLMPFSGNNLLK